METIKQQKRQIIAYKIVRYTYQVKNDSGTLICAFNDKQIAEDYKIILIDKTKFELPTYIYNVEPVYEYFNFIEFLTSQKQ